MSRFERKIAVAIAIVALAPLIGGLIFGRIVLRDAYRTGVNVEFATHLREGVEVRQDYLRLLGVASRRSVDIIEAEAKNALLQNKDIPCEAWVARFDDVKRVSGTRTFTSKEGSKDDPSSGPICVGKTDDTSGGNWRRAKRLREYEGPEGSFRLEVEVAVPRAPFERLHDADEAAKIYGRLVGSENYVASVYLLAYALTLLIVIAIALAIGVIVSRRATRRVHVLAEAARRVGRGDLSVSVPIDSRDEVAELSGAFNEMVRDLSESRARIAYLQRIGAWQDFARRLAHEIKNPLTPIQLAVQEVHDTFEGDDDAYRHKLEEARSIVEEEVATLRRLVSEFSAFAKLPDAHLVPSDLCDLIESMRISIPGILEDVGVSEDDGVGVHVTCATNPIPMRMDPMMFKRCLDNLVRNAVQAVHQTKRRDGLVVLEAVVDGQQTVIEVRDNGPGISDDVGEHVFDPYYTTKSEGTGLGLPIVKKIVLEHGGEITLHRAPEGGACFRMRFPLLAETRS